MSREERRQYERQMRSMEKGASLPPAAKARADRNAARRAARRPAGQAPAGAFGRGFWIRAALIAVALGFAGFSLQWSEGMPRALYVGLIVAAIALGVLVGFRYLQRRASISRS